MEKQPDWKVRLLNAKGEYEDFFRINDDRVFREPSDRSNLDLSRLITEFLRYNGSTSQVAFRDGHNIVRAYAKGKKVVFHLSAGKYGEEKERWTDVDGAIHIIVHNGNHFIHVFDNL